MYILVFDNQIPVKTGGVRYGGEHYDRGYYEDSISIYTSEIIEFEDADTILLVKNYIESNKHIPEGIDDIDNTAYHTFNIDKTIEFIDLISNNMKLSIQEVGKEYDQKNSLYDYKYNVSKNYNILNNDTYKIGLEYVNRKRMKQPLFHELISLNLVDINKPINWIERKIHDYYYLNLNEISQKIISKQVIDASPKYLSSNSIYCNLVEMLEQQRQAIDNSLSDFIVNVLNDVDKYPIKYSKYSSKIANTVECECLTFSVLCNILDCSFKLNLDRTFLSFLSYLKTTDLLKEISYESVFGNHGFMYLYGLLINKKINKGYCEYLYKYIMILESFGFHLSTDDVNYLIRELKDISIFIDFIHSLLETDKVQIFKENGDLYEGVKECKSFDLVLLARYYIDNGLTYFDALKSRNRKLIAFYRQYGASQDYYYSRKYNEIMKREKLIRTKSKYSDDDYDWLNEVNDYYKSMYEDFGGGSSVD